jgi:hypothetical protein
MIEAFIENPLIRLAVTVTELYTFLLLLSSLWKRLTNNTRAAKRQLARFLGFAIPVVISGILLLTIGLLLTCSASASLGGATCLQISTPSIFLEAIWTVSAFMAFPTVLSLLVMTHLIRHSLRHISFILRNPRARGISPFTLSTLGLKPFNLAVIAYYIGLFVAIAAIMGDELPGLSFLGLARTVLLGTVLFGGITLIGAPLWMSLILSYEP